MAEEKPKPPNTISDAKWKRIQEKAAKANPRHWVDPAEVKARLATNEQFEKRKWS